MILFTDFSNKIAFLLILGLLFFPSLADAGEIKKENPAVGEERIRIAVFPVENLSGTRCAGQRDQADVHRKAGG